jgi:hypothetical protein
MQCGRLNKTDTKIPIVIPHIHPLKVSGKIYKFPFGEGIFFPEATS